MQLSPLFVILPFIILTLTNRSSSAIGRNLLIALWVGGISLATQYVVAMFLGAETPAIIGSVAAIVALVLYNRTVCTEKR